MNPLGVKFFGVVLSALALFGAVSLISYSPADPPDSLVFPEPVSVRNLCGPLGAQAASLLLNQFGIAAFFLLLPMGFGVYRCFKGKGFDQLFLRTLGLCFMVAALAGMAAMSSMPVIGFHVPAVGPGGWLGKSVVLTLDRFVAPIGSFAFLSSVYIAGLFLCGDRVLLCFHRIFFARKEAAVEEAGGQTDESPPVAVPNPDDDLAGYEPTFENGPVFSARPGRMLSQADRSRTLEIRDEERTFDEPVVEYQLPSTELLTPPELYDQELSLETIHRQAVALEKAFADFKLQVEVVDIQTGPVISQFELRLAKGLRLNKIQALSDDLAIALKVPSVRIVAPIPGKNTVGVELPNEHRQMVRLRDVMEQRPEAEEKYNIPVYLGKDVSGQPLVIDLTKLPHLLIAGRTGTGKSVCLNSIIVSMLMTRSPEQVRMLMIDPKMVELSPYKTIPHLMHPVVTDMRKAEAILGWAVEKMEERYQLLAAAGVRQLSEYNRLSETELRRRMRMEDSSFEDWDAIPKSMPYLVIIADEMADLMMTAAKEVETHIIRLAQKSRAVGIHLVLATQKPTVDIVTGLIKSNLPARIAFGVATRTDSQVVLDRTGAERLLGNGDMLFLQPNTGLAVRGQGTYVSDSEIESIIDEIGTDEPDFVEELVALDPEDGDKPAAGGAEEDKDLRDELYNEAVEYIIQEGRGSLSLLQRRFSIGYGRAARLIDYMAEDGVVGTYNGSQAREVLMTLSDWRKVRSQGLKSSAPSPVSPSQETARAPAASSKVPRQVPVRRGVPIRPAIAPELIDTSNEPRLRPKYAEPVFAEEDDDDYGEIEFHGEEEFEGVSDWDDDPSVPLYPKRRSR